MNELEQLWRERIDWVQASGLTIAAASAELGVSVASVYRWKKLLAASPASGRHRARPVMRASSCCWPISCRPTGMPPTLISGTVTTGANSIDEGALNTKSPVGRGASGWPGTSPDQIGAGPGQERVIAASASCAAAACTSCACW